MIKRALDAGFRPEWVTADEAYGHDGKLRLWLEELRQPYVLAVPSNEYAARDFGKVKVNFLCGELPKGAVVGRNSFGKVGYEICPEGTNETYIFTLFALPKKLSPAQGFEPLGLRTEVANTSGDAGVLALSYTRG